MKILMHVQELAGKSVLGNGQVPFQLPLRARLSPRPVDQTPIIVSICIHMGF